MDWRLNNTLVSNPVVILMAWCDWYIKPLFILPQNNLCILSGYWGISLNFNLWRSGVQFVSLDLYRDIICVYDKKHFTKTEHFISVQLVKLQAALSSYAGREKRRMNNRNKLFQLSRFYFLRLFAQSCILHLHLHLRWRDEIVSKWEENRQHCFNNRHAPHLVSTIASKGTCWIAWRITCPGIIIESSLVHTAPAMFWPLRGVKILFKLKHM